MFEVDIDLSQFEQLATVFSPAVRQKILTAVGKRMGVAAESVVSQYPPQTRKPLEKVYTRTSVAGKKTRPWKSKYKSDKQQFYVTQVLAKNGSIPYRRTGTLGRSITSQVVQATPVSVSVAIGSAIPYAKYVIGAPPDQSKYHEGNWTPLVANIEANLSKINTVAQETLNDELAKALRGD